jgi:hypothetical protein
MLNVGATAFTHSLFVRHSSEGWDPSKACFQEVSLEGFQPSLE